MIGEVIALAGATLTLVAALGVIRFPSALTRMHALTKASTLGLALVAIGATFVLPTANDMTTVIIATLYLMTLPIAASMIARATYHSVGVPNRLDTIDELGERLAHDAEISHEKDPDDSN